MCDSVRLGLALGFLLHCARAPTSRGSHLRSLPKHRPGTAARSLLHLACRFTVSNDRMARPPTLTSPRGATTALPGLNAPSATGPPCAIIQSDARGQRRGNSRLDSRLLAKLAWRRSYKLVSWGNGSTQFTMMAHPGPVAEWIAPASDSPVSACLRLTCFSLPHLLC